ncbi:hypothetical protein ACFQ6N_38035 [Kitasatospora sp. NPDC056446]
MRHGQGPYGGGRFDGVVGVRGGGGERGRGRDGGEGRQQGR